VNGAPPFVASTVPELFAKILTLDRLEWPAKAPIALRAVVERWLRKNPADRFPNGRDAHRAIEGVRSGPASLWSAWRYRLRRRRWTAATAALIVLALGAGVVFRGAIDRLAGIFRGQTIRLAVLPFENLTGDPAQQYLSDGLTDELITPRATASRAPAGDRQDILHAVPQPRRDPRRDWTPTPRRLRARRQRAPRSRPRAHQRHARAGERPGAKVVGQLRARIVGDPIARKRRRIRRRAIAGVVASAGRAGRASPDRRR
jgi:hypothetical protein